ncbi:oligosaccharide flippase family protein [Flavobacterium sp.]|uniref:oligosaccharide flippase family protein n=1 Tax=Flavobacterium sp. TaxID=239 RepID=UPI00263033B7|nr:oligosaccharide flippase family protein [Flavobacterium sp.]MDD3004609.1 oligosaccharide flippase family protein [Flavobacterium sp.]
MGIVINQSAKNIFVTYFGFGIGAINALFLYTSFLGKTHYGIVSFLLSAANIMMPLMALGVHSTLIRFYATYTDDKERDKFMSFMLLMPLLLIIPISLITLFGYDVIVKLLIAENPKIEPFVWLIPVVGLFMGYFEIFYAWVKVHMKSVYGNFISEVLVRIITLVLLFMVHWEVIDKNTFIYGLSAAYGVQVLAMMSYAFHLKKPKLHFEIPANAKAIFGYSFYIILSGGVAVLLLDLDKVMIPYYIDVDVVSVYSVGIFIATVIAVPSRAMLQIIYPMTAKLISENKMDELATLYKKSALNLQVFGGLILVCIFLNIKQMYLIIPDNYGGGMVAVFLIGIAKFYDVILGNNNAILLNTKYYSMALLFGVILVLMMIGLNMLLIPLYGITGCALATLISVVFYNSIKLWFIVKKMNLYPFGPSTFKSFGIIITVLAAFYFWDFSFHPFINIILKSGIIALVYVYLNYKFKISTDINYLIDHRILKYKK